MRFYLYLHSFSNSLKVGTPTNGRVFWTIGDSSGDTFFETESFDKGAGLVADLSLVCQFADNNFEGLFSELAARRDNILVPATKFCGKIG